MKEFKLIVAGGRDFDNYSRLSKVVTDLATSPDLYGSKSVSIVSGMARGADALGHRFALENNVTVHEFPADWNSFGKQAGFVRNEEMAHFSDALVAFWNGQSVGTKHMIEFMKKLNKPVYVINY